MFLHFFDLGSGITSSTVFAACMSAGLDPREAPIPIERARIVIELPAADMPGDLPEDEETVAATTVPAP